jgi:hypothetical protein
MTVGTKNERETTAEYLEDALEDLNQARLNAEEELRSRIDSTISRAREALDDVRSDAQDRADRFKVRAEERAAEWQRTLEGATEDARRELGIRAVHAQRTRDALDAMSDEIKHHKKELAAH